MQRAKFMFLLVVFILVSFTLYFIRYTNVNAAGMAVLNDATMEGGECASADSCAAEDVCCTIDSQSFCASPIKCKSLFYASTANNRSAFGSNPVMFFLAAMLISVGAWILLVRPVSK
ncbi:MAG: hypothetical protein KJ709_08055 [Nanoarchaeota archaeon]|nr:hypothetical protein [Nanoarchaeota archaeon]